MQVKLIENQIESAPKNRLNEFPEETWGVIKAWRDSTDFYIGTVVILRNGVLETIKSLLTKERFYWPNFDELKSSDGHFYIEPLPLGTKIEITL